MSDQDLFDENKEPKDDGTPNPDDKSGQGDNSDTYLGMILNEEGKQKYDTTEEALKGSVHAQSHISNLEAELKELRANAEKGVNMEEILKAVSGKKDDKSEVPTGITPEQLAETVTQLLDSRDSKQTQEGNIATVIGTFKSLYGEKASETMYSKANDLGFSKSEINGMIATNPKAALKVLGVDASKVKASDPMVEGSSFAAESFSGKEPEQPKSIMGATNSKQLTDSWKASQAATLKRLGVENA